MLKRSPTLHMLYGNIASGKSTLAAALGRSNGVVVISEDIWLHALYGDDLRSLSDYSRLSARLCSVMGRHVAEILNAGLSVVLDFPANTIEQRRWMRDILAQTRAAHLLHVLDVPEEVCLARLRERNRQGEHPFVVTEAQFRRITAHPVPPAPDEGFTVTVHGASA
ncbi:MAG TPA: ATP-binding protein [Aliiroseovarius sp.]|nr:ATP-binding protein [Aliiroseovarius sp.]